MTPTGRPPLPPGAVAPANDAAGAPIAAPRQVPPALIAAGGPDAATAQDWLHASPAAMARVSATGALCWANPAAAVALGGLGDSAAGQPLALLLGLDAADTAALHAALASAGSAEVQRRSSNGSSGWLAVQARALADGSRLLAIQPIDALKTQAARADRLAELLDLARAMGRIGAWERDLHTGRGRWDPEVFRMRGLEQQDEAPSLEETMRSVLEVDRQPFADCFANSLGRPGRYAHRFRVIAPDGTLRQLHSQWIVKPGDEGRPPQAIGLIMDDTQAWALSRSYDEMVSQLALAVDMAGIAIWRHDLVTNKLFLNEQAARVLDTDAHPEGVTVDGVRDLIHPDDVQAGVQAFEAALSTGRPVDTELRYRRRDGSWRTMITRQVPQRDATGRPLAMMGVALDITERQDTSRRAVELARRFELATRAAGIGHWSSDGGNERPLWSDELRAIHGLAHDAPAPTTREWFDHWVHPDDRADGRRRFTDWVKSGRRSVEAELRVVRTDGQTRYLILHSRIEGADAAQPLLFGLVIDVTERRNVEMALRQAGERAALAARGAGLGTWELDLRDNAVFWDEQMWRLRGRTPRAVAPTPAEMLGWVLQEDRDEVERNMAEPGDTIAAHREFRVLLPDGGVRWLASRSVAVADDDGRPVRRIGVNWDITDSRTADAVRRERELALRESQAKSKFLARMSHELRTPLNAVLGFAQLLQSEERAGDAAAASRGKRLAHIRSAGEHLLELINDVLELSSLEGGELRIALQPVPLAPVVAQTLALLQPVLRAHRVELVTGALDVLPMADPTRLRQVLLNLLSNAAKYSRDGGRVLLEAMQQGGGVVVRVADNGRGMDDEQLRHLFEPFNRLGAERDNIEGTGIGLAIVKALVERMGGSVHVHSTVGVGSVFELRLADGAGVADTPAARPSASALHSDGTAAAPSRAPRPGTLLYVEDNPVNALIVSELIARRADLQLQIAVDGLSGVRMATDLRPDLVLLDMQLPDIDGHEVLRRLRAQASTAHIPVIALSANAMPEDIDRALRAGMSDYWTKPLDFRAFMASIDALFGPDPQGPG